MSEKLVFKSADHILSGIGDALGNNCPEFKDYDVKVGAGICVDKNGEGNPGGLTDPPDTLIMTDPPMPVDEDPKNEVTQFVVVGATNLISPDQASMSPIVMVDEENTDLLLEDLLKVAIGNPDASTREDAIAKIRNNQSDQIDTDDITLKIQTNPTAPPGSEELFRFVTLTDMLSKSHSRFFSNLLGAEGGLIESALVFFYPSSDQDKIVDQMVVLLELGVQRFIISLTGLFEDPSNPTMNPPQYYEELENSLVSKAVERNDDFSGKILRASASYDSTSQQTFNVLNPLDYAINFFTRTIEFSVLSVPEAPRPANADLRLVVTTSTSSSATAALIFGTLGLSPPTAYSISRLINGKTTLSGLQVVGRSGLSGISLEDILSGEVDLDDFDSSIKSITITGSGVSKLVPGDVMYSYIDTYEPAKDVDVLCQFNPALNIDVSVPNSITIFGQIRFDIPLGGGILFDNPRSGMSITTVLRKLDPYSLTDVDETPPFTNITGDFVYLIRFKMPALIGSQVPLPVELYKEFRQLGTLNFYFNQDGVQIGEGGVVRIFRS
jgi:hypothetical protein